MYVLGEIQMFDTSFSWMDELVLAFSTDSCHSGENTSTTEGLAFFGDEEGQKMTRDLCCIACLEH